MNDIKRHSLNPLLKPDPQHDWESFAVFNPSVIKLADDYYMFYRALSDEKMVAGKKARISTIGTAISSDGVQFTDRFALIKPEEAWEKFGCEDPRVTSIDGQNFLFYTALSAFPPTSRSIKVAGAVLSSDLQSVQEKHLITPFNAKAFTLFPEKINGKYTAFLTVDTDQPPSHIACAQFEKIETLWDQNFWQQWYSHYQDYTVPLCRISNDQVEIGARPIKTSKGWVLIYSYIKNYFSNAPEFRIEAVLLDPFQPHKIIGRIEVPCLIPEADYELHGTVPNIVFPSGAVVDNDELKIYYGGADTYCCVATTPFDSFMRQFQLNAPNAIKCEKFFNNPLLTPIATSPNVEDQEITHTTHPNWESKAVFNPAAFKLDEKVYILYRTLSDKDVSAIGLAISDDGIYIDERLDEPIYWPKSQWDTAVDSDHNYGCEDPRVTVMHEHIYMCYTAYDGKLPRLAMTSISIADFLARRWDNWTAPKIISPPGLADKDGCLFPEKLNGKYVFFHRIEPHIRFGFVDDLEFSKQQFLNYEQTIYPGPRHWEENKTGVNTTPIKTPVGWLVFYHGVSTADHHYRVGALLLDLNDPTIVLARTNYPILEPEHWFEKEGIVNNVVFPCGAVEYGKYIYLYYGGADKYVCGAKIRTQELLDYLTCSVNKRYLQWP